MRRKVTRQALIFAVVVLGQIAHAESWRLNVGAQSPDQAGQTRR
jgi:hypothetical protein